MIFELSSAAVGDLQSIRDYTLANWGEDQEQKYLDRMWSKFEEIQTDPDRWKFRNDLFKGCQIAAEGKHVILFRVEGEIIQIARILHGAMDFRQRLRGEE